MWRFCDSGAITCVTTYLLAYLLTYLLLFNESLYCIVSTTGCQSLTDIFGATHV